MDDDKRKVIGSIFLLGFICGTFFSYSGLLGFSAGFISGIIFHNTILNQEKIELEEETKNSYERIKNYLYTYIKEK